MAAASGPVLATPVTAPNGKRKSAENDENVGQDPRGAKKSSAALGTPYPYDTVCTADKKG